MVSNRQSLENVMKKEGIVETECKKKKTKEKFSQ